jgi:molecular chaperone GrpE
MSNKPNTSDEELRDNHSDNQKEFTVDDSDSIIEETSVEEIQEPTAEEKLNEANDKFIRLYAEFENFRKRTNKEKVDLLSHASAGVLKDMLPVMDDFERAISNNVNIEDEKLLKEGFQLIFTKFKSIMEGKGIKEMKSKGEVFDSEVHEAIANVPAPNANLVGKVVDDVEKGYYLNDKVIRFAKVVVGQ